MKKFWELAGTALGELRGPSQEDLRALSLMEDSIQRGDGHYMVSIPFRDNPGLENNRSMAECRLRGLERRLMKNPELKGAYQEGIQKLLDKGHAEVVTEVQDPPGRTWYLPHHPVLSSNKKARIVFDCAAESNGTSLNKEVLQGPDLNNTLLGVLLRFRQHPVAITADIEAMFHQVRVPVQQRDVLRFLWRPDKDLEPKTYRMTVHLFGGTWSPSVCTFALKQLAKDYEENFPAKVIEAVRKDFYVDDFLKTLETEEEANLIVQEVTQLLSHGGFRLCKWQSNRLSILQQIQDTEVAADFRNLDSKVLPTERTLGVMWDLEEDQLTYSNLTVKPPLTRRGMLGLVCSVYDPLGIIAPFTVIGRLLVQEQTKSQRGWDEPLEEGLQQRWKGWMSQLDSLSRIKVTRCVKPKNFGRIQRCELHHFADGSTVAYGAVTYARLVNEHGEVHCSLITARARVAPLKKISVPRLELLAATLATRLDTTLRSELTIPIDESKFWTDSTIVLAYIKNESRRFQTFVTNRLSMIHETSKPTQWCHVRTEVNPAYHLSRGLSIAQIHQSDWLTGPQLLWKRIVRNQEDPTLDSLDGDPEVKREVRVHATETTCEAVDLLIESYSSWYKLKKSVAWILRYKSWLLSKARQKEDTTHALVLHPEELKGAERAIVTYVQARTYATEIKTSTREERIREASPIYSLDPVMRNGLLVCNGRLRHDQTTELVQGRSPILPKDHHLTTLIVRHMHEASGHSGREYTVSAVRQVYWILGLRCLVRNLINACVTCRRLHGKPQTPRMADLPKERIAVDKPPFTHIGVDCFGPFDVKSGRTVRKRYGCIFTCMTVRAVHIEVLPSMDTTAFLNALQRFISRRGKPETITSDNGTNFVGAQREIARSSALTNFLQRKEIS